MDEGALQSSSSGSLCKKTCDWLKGSNGWRLFSTVPMRPPVGDQGLFLKSTLQRAAVTHSHGKQTFISSCRGKTTEETALLPLEPSSHLRIFPVYFSQSHALVLARTGVSHRGYPTKLPLFCFSSSFCFSLISIKTIFHLCRICSCASMHHMGSL